jgi:hypothetical protein
LSGVFLIRRFLTFFFDVWLGVANCMIRRFAQLGLPSLAYEKRHGIHTLE